MSDSTLAFTPAAYALGCRILLFKGRGIVSTLIRWQTRSEYSHAAILLPDGTIIEAWQGAGVRRKIISDWTDVDSFMVTAMTPAQWASAIDFAAQQIGKGYDYKGVIRFLSRQSLKLDSRWFCSELVFAALERAGVAVLSRVDASEVSPAMLSLSPLLISKSGREIDLP